MGGISGNGTTADEIWQSLKAGEAKRNTIVPELYFDPASNPKAYRTRKEAITTVCGSSLTNDQLAERINESAKRFDRHQLFAMIAAQEAISAAKVEGAYDPNRAGCVVGTGDGGLHEKAIAHERLAEGKALLPTSNLRELPNIFAGYLTQRHNLRGPNFVHCTACAASSHALQHAADLIRLDDADMVLTGGTDAAISKFGISSFCSQQALSNESLPYQVGRQGFVMGEGSVMIVLEELERAMKRGAPILAEVTGWASTADGVKEGLIAAPSAQGGARSAMLAMRKAGISLFDLSAIYTHGTGTLEGDPTEIEGILSWAGADAADIPVSATKAQTGHLLGAAGAIAIMIAVNSLRERLVLATHGLTRENFDAACAGVLHVMGEHLSRRLKNVLVNSFGFGGTNSSVVVRHIDA